MIRVTVDVSKETYEFGIGLSKFIAAVRASLDDGFQYGDDIPDIVSSAISDLLPSLDGLSAISDEYSENPEIFFRTVSLIGLEVVKALEVFNGASTD